MQLTLTLIYIALIIYIIYLIHKNINKEKIIKFTYEPKSNLPIIKFYIKGYPLKMYLDTGANITTICKSFIEKADLTHKLKDTPTTVQTAGNVINNVQTINNVTVIYKDKIKNKKSAFCFNKALVIDDFDDNIKGVVGSDFLRRYKFQIDYKNDCIYKRFI